MVEIDKVMLNQIFYNQTLVFFLITSFWIIPGLFFSKFTDRKFKRRKKERQEKRIAKLYPS
tara:strand:+ start:880 stop:1062 length:183 start_codon:yes stop_codon:yes gene_type:complete